MVGAVFFGAVSFGEDGVVNSDRSTARTISRGAAVVLLAEAVVLGIILSRFPGGLRLPVTVDLGGDLTHTGRRIVLTQVDIGVAIVVLCVLVAIARLLGASRTARAVEFSATSSITVFLVAQLNGITGVGTLVLVYAATSAMTLFNVLSDHGAVSDAGLGSPRRGLPRSFGAAIGIVPWGVIAFHQIGAGVIGIQAPFIVRVITLVMLAAAILFGFTQWRESGRQESGPAASGWEKLGGTQRGEFAHVLLSTVATSVFAWLVVLGLIVTRLAVR